MINSEQLQKLKDAAAALEAAGADIFNAELTAIKARIVDEEARIVAEVEAAANAAQGAVNQAASEVEEHVSVPVKNWWATSGRNHLQDVATALVAIAAIVHLIKQVL